MSYNILENARKQTDKAEQQGLDDLKSKLGGTSSGKDRDLLQGNASHKLASKLAEKRTSRTESERHQANTSKHKDESRSLRDVAPKE
jgi:hypothetical protein